MNTLGENASLYGISLSEDATARHLRYFEIVWQWNARLHLVAPCTPGEFATRHVLESLLAERFILERARVTDVGSGAGLPIIPCLIARPDVRATLIESSSKKTVFLREALRKVERHEQATVVNERFERAAPPDADFLTCRALDRFTEIFPQLVEWSARIKILLLFGGESLREQLERAGLGYNALHVPQSERRFLFVVRRAPISVHVSECI